MPEQDLRPAEVDVSVHTEPEVVLDLRDEALELPVVKSPLELARWYRRIPQDRRISQSDIPLMVEAAERTKKNGEGQFLLKDSRPDKNQPVMLDAGSMFLEAAFASTDDEVSEMCFDQAEGIFTRLIGDKRCSAYAQVDAFMFLTDVKMMRLMKDQPEDKGRFMSDYIKIHRESVQGLNALIRLNSGNEEYPSGDLFELFWVLGNRHADIMDGIEQGDIEQRLRNTMYRSSYTREDRSHIHKSGNFDVAMLERHGSKWLLAEKTQLGDEAKEKSKYDPDVNVFIYNPKGSGERLKNRLLEWTEMISSDLDLLYKHPDQLIPKFYDDQHQHLMSMVKASGTMA